MEYPGRNDDFLGDVDVLISEDKCFEYDSAIVF